MSREELISLVEKIMKSEGTEEEEDNLLELLEKNLLDPQVSNYIYYEENTPEEVVDKARKLVVCYIRASGIGYSVNYDII